MKIEDALLIMRSNASDAEVKMRSRKVRVEERLEAMATKRAYAHCIGLLEAVIEKKGWSSGKNSSPGRRRPSRYHA